jgi:hypothetical protein
MSPINRTGNFFMISTGFPGGRQGKAKSSCFYPGFFILSSGESTSLFSLLHNCELLFYLFQGQFCWWYWTNTWLQSGLLFFVSPEILFTRFLVCLRCQPRTTQFFLSPSEKAATRTQDSNFKHRPKIYFLPTTTTAVNFRPP